MLSARGHTPITIRILWQRVSAPMPRTVGSLNVLRNHSYHRTTSNNTNTYLIKSRLNAAPT